MQTQTHYTDAGGQHYLPTCMQDATITAGTTIVDGDDYDAMGDDERDAIRDACRALGIETEIDDCGGLVATSVRDDDRLEAARDAFRADDRFAVIDSSDIGCHGGDGPRSARVARAAAWMLDAANFTAFVAVLDPEDDTVATLDDDGHVVWEPLVEFCAGEGLI